MEKQKVMIDCSHKAVIKGVKKADFQHVSEKVQAFKRIRSFIIS